MKRLRTLGCLLLLSLGLQAWGESESIQSIQGEWKLSGMIHHGRPISLPNPDLNLRWTFFSNGTLRLFWDRGGVEFCEGFGHFKLEQGTLHNIIFALNPQNSAECAKDSDLQLGRETHTPIDFEPERIRLHFQLGDEELIYVLSRVIAP